MMEKFEELKPGMPGAPLLFRLQPEYPLCLGFGLKGISVLPPNNSINFRSLRSLDSNKLRFCFPVSLIVVQIHNQPQVIGVCNAI